MATEVKQVNVPAKTQVARITVGSPIRKVTGTSAQRLNDLIDVTITDVENDHILQYNSATGQWENDGVLNGGTF
jgi:hypothetical protein